MLDCNIDKCNLSPSITFHGLNFKFYNSTYIRTEKLLKVEVTFIAHSTPKNLSSINGPPRIFKKFSYQVETYEHQK